MKFAFQNLCSAGHTFKLLLVQNLHQEALKSSLLLPSPLLTDQVYACFLKSGHVLDNYLSSSLITHFSKCGDFLRSRGFLLDTKKPETGVFIALLSRYVRFHQTTGTFSLYSKLANSGLKPDKYTISSLIKSCDNTKGTEVADSICMKLGLNFNNFLVSGLVQKYAKFGRVESAEKCFQESMVLDDIVLTAMINGFVWNDDLRRVKVLS